ncbi:MAG TPA: L,D-transpeptidase, partial [Flavisolibacter sp.]|nr:L,D-transpeptidase [Flavisolibacter sp.]
MKITILVSCVIAAGGFLMNTASNEKTTEKVLVSTRTTTAKKKMSAKPFGPVRIVVDKSSYELTVYDQHGWYATYPVVFGHSSLADKKMEGDRLTPEGTFRISNKRVHQKWTRFMGLDYPNKESIEKFNERKRRGEIPAWATPGGGVGIHGCWPKEDFVVDRYNNWTNGCIALKRVDVEDLYSYIPLGTPIT